MQTEGGSQAEQSATDIAAPFYISSGAMGERARYVLKQDDSFAILDSYGDMGASSGGQDGFFDRDTRFLSRLELLIEGMPPLLLGSSVRDDNLTLTTDLTNTDIFVDGHIALARDAIHIVRTTYLWRRVLHQRIAIGNHSDSSISFKLAIFFGNDFADLFEVRGQRRPRRGTLTEELCGDGKICFIYEGLDGRTRSTSLTLAPSPFRIAASAATYHLKLNAHQSTHIYLAAACEAPSTIAPTTFLRGLMAANRNRRRASKNAAIIETSNTVLNETLRRAMADLQILTTETPEGAYPYAGIPWYSTTFGRDGLLTAIQMLLCDPTMAKGVLKRLAALQAVESDAASEAEPGKIMHEMRGGEMAALKEVPFGLYYGSVDATPLFVILAGLYFERTGDISTLRELWNPIERALAWMETYGDRDGDGFLEYGAENSEGLHHGLRNQGWKDSFDAIYHSDGALAKGPIALCEVQGYAYYAKRLAAKCARRLNHSELADKLDHSAELLAHRFEERFWCEEIGLYAIALDGEKRQCRIRSSNAGHVLWTGIARPDRARRVADAMISSDFFSGWGIRTIAKNEARYNPMSYHNGSVWPHDNSFIALGFSRYGLGHHAERVFDATFAAATYMDMRRLPELYCGFRKRPGSAPTKYPVACAPQAWASGSLLLMLQAILGVEWEPFTNEIRFRNPRLPRAIDQIELRGLRLAGNTLDIELQRAGRHVALRVAKCTGNVEVAMIADGRDSM
jgi:glycogen debranching enzyme